MGGVEEGEGGCGRWLESWLLGCGEDCAGWAVGDCDCVVDLGQVAFCWEVGDGDLAGGAGGGVCW